MALPIALEIVVLVLIGFGPASAERWFLKGLLVGLGGLTLSLGAFLAWTLLRTRRSPLVDELFARGRHATVAAALAGESAEVLVLRGRTETDRGERDRLPRAPLTERPCLAYAVTVFRVEGTAGGHGGTWLRLGEETRSVPFWLRDATGRIRIDPTGARLSGVPSGGGEVDIDDAESLGELERWLESAGLGVRLQRTESTVGYAVEEEVVPLDAEVTVIGFSLDRADERVVAAASTGTPLVIDAVETDFAVALRRMTGWARVAAVAVPLVGLAMVGGGFWWVLAD